MKALTIKQPWASLIALGEKKMETRSWKTNYRGPLLIHAGKSIDKIACKLPEIYGVMEDYEYPTGVIIAKCNLVDCVKIKYDMPYFDGADLENGMQIGGNEYEFGDYTEGRYAWILDNVEMLKEPIPAKGQLSLWEYKEGLG
jgi:hypothetical protein